MIPMEENKPDKRPVNQNLPEEELRILREAAQEIDEEAADKAAEEAAANQPPRWFPFTLRDLLDGRGMVSELITKRLPFVLFLAFVAVIYIGNRYHAERVSRDIDKMTQRVKELRTEALMTERDYMDMSRQTEILKAVRQRQLNIVESESAPVVIK